VVVEAPPLALCRILSVETITLRTHGSGRSPADGTLIHVDCSKGILKTRRAAVATTGRNTGAIETPLREVGEQMSGSVLGARIPGGQSIAHVQR